MSDAASTLDTVALFGDLDADARAALAARCAWRRYRPQQEIIGRESETRDVFFVTAGSVRVVNWSYSGREVSFEDITAGGYFGELAAIDGAPRSASVIALEDSTVGSLDSDAFMAAVLGDAATARRLMERFASVIRRSTERIFDLSVHGANIRIYAELLKQADPDRADGNTAIIRPVPIHSDIAARVSTTRETVARVMGDLARSKLVIREKEQLVVTDLDRLAELVHE